MKWYNALIHVQSFFRDKRTCMILNLLNIRRVEYFSFCRNQGQSTTDMEGPLLDAKLYDSPVGSFPYLAKNPIDRA